MGPNELGTLGTLGTLGAGGRQIDMIRPRTHSVPALARDNKGLIAVCALFVVFWLSFANFSVGGDGWYYFSFVQRLFGDRSSSSATGYGFGVGIMNAPFYGAEQLVVSVVTIPGIRAPDQAVIAVASLFWIVVALTSSWWLLARLDLPHPGLALGVAFFGTPVWFYGSFLPSYSHAADAAIWSLSMVGLYQILHREKSWYRFGTGVALALAIAVRSANVGALVGVCLALVAYKRTRDAAWVAGVTGGVYGLLIAIPLFLGTSLIRYHGANILTDTTGLSPLSPVRMLFTLHRGLFLWTPVAALSVAGLVIAIRRGRNRPFLVALAAAAAGLLLTYTNVKTWDAAGSFSSRFLAAPLVFYAVGMASLFDAARGYFRLAVMAIAVVAAAFAVFVGMNQSFGSRISDGVDTIIGNYFDGGRSPADFAHLAWSRSHLRQILHRVAG